MSNVSATTQRQWILKSRPVGPIDENTFEWNESEIPSLGEGEVLCRNLYLSLDPAMRGWISEADNYIEPVELGSVMRGACIAEVIESKRPEFTKGDTILAMLGWQEYGVLHKGESANKLPTQLGLPVTNFLSILGIPGLTAYFGLNEIGKPQAGETVLVSAAAGAVGSAAGQLAKLKGCRVVGLAGIDEKCRWLTEELGFDDAINYKTENIREAIRRTCPDRINIYFDNVGGDILNEAFDWLNIGARLVICGAMKRFNRTDKLPGPDNYYNVVAKRARMEGFVLLDYQPRFMEAIGALAPLVLQKKIKFREDVVDGLDQAPTAIHKLYNGTNTGKLIVKIAENSTPS